MKVKRNGVTRLVILTERWALKIPKVEKDSRFFLRGVRGWIANRSEWRQRNRPDVARPRFTFLHLVLVMPRARFTGAEWEAFAPICIGPTVRDQVRAVPFWLEDDPRWESTTEEDLLHRDERKPCSWGWFGEHDGWKLIDFDRGWVHPDDGGDRGIIGGWYYGRQEKMARQWA